MPILSNPKHELYAQGLAKGETQVDAYAAAGYKANDGHAARLAGDGRIVARVSEILAAGAERAEITREMVVRELGRIGFSDIRKMFTENGSLVPIHQMGDEAAACLSAIEVVTRKLPGGEATEVEHLAKIKTWDKRAALVDIAKMQGWLVEKHELTGKNGAPIETIDRTPRDIAKDIAFTLAKGAKEQSVTH